MTFLICAFLSLLPLKSSCSLLFNHIKNPWGPRFHLPEKRLLCIDAVSGSVFSKFVLVRIWKRICMDRLQGLQSRLGLIGNDFQPLPIVPSGLSLVWLFCTYSLLMFLFFHSAPSYTDISTPYKFGMALIVKIGNIHFGFFCSLPILIFSYRLDIFPTSPSFSQEFIRSWLHKGGRNHRSLNSVPPVSTSLRRCWNSISK
jgi:hypothetical protein